jgi:hypothetical protein
MVGFIQEIRNLLGNIRYGWQEIKTPYIDNKVLNERYIESRDLCKKKIESTFAHLKNNDLTQALYEKFIADEYLDAAHLWERKSRLAKYINDNRDHVRGSLIGMFSDYATSLGTAGGAALTSSSAYSNGSDVLSDIIFFGFIIVSGLTFITGVVNQKRLNRLVKEHKDYTREFEETTDLIEKKNL